MINLSSWKRLIKQSLSAHMYVLQVLVDIPNESLPMLNEIIKLVTPRFQTLVGYVLQVVPKDILQSIIDSEPQSTIRIIECMDPHNAQFRRNRFASITKKWVQFFFFFFLSYLISFGDLCPVGLYMFSVLF